MTCTHALLAIGWLLGALPPPIAHAHPPQQTDRGATAGDSVSASVTIVWDYNGDDRINLSDHAFWPACLTGPGAGSVTPPCSVFDGNFDADVDLADARAYQIAFGINKHAPPNDNCRSPVEIFEGQTPFDNIGATTDGPPEFQACDFFNDDQIGSDVWFLYTTTCVGEIVVSLCGSFYDTKMAVYTTSTCPTAPPIACSDDDCGATIESRVAFASPAEGVPILIRVGGFLGEQGTGLIHITACDDACGLESGDCFAELGNNTRGCNDIDCCETTCDVDPFCCDIVWDDTCAAEAAGLCTGGFDTCAAGAGSCASGHADGAPGCDDVDCCNTVCAHDPFCCVDSWDQICAQTALSACFLTCGGNSGGCFVPGGNSTPGCEDQACCEIVCAADPFCCEEEWDDTCVDRAVTDCP